MPTKFFWIVASGDGGQPILIFGDRDENTARQKGMAQLNGIDFKLVELPTRSLPQASRLLRGKTLDETHDLSKATARQMHSGGLRRLQDKIRHRFSF